MFTENEMNSTYIEYKSRVNNVCSIYAEKSAIVYMRENGERTVTTFGEMLHGYKKLADIILKANIVPGDRVAVITPHSPQGILSALGLAYNNVTAVLIDASLPADEINRLLEHADVRGVFTTEKIYLLIDKEIKRYIPIFKLCEKENEYTLFSDSVSSTRKERTIDPELDVIAILFSSGTTAQMKGIKVTYSSIMKSSDIFIRNVEWKAEYNYLHVFPLNHIAGYATVHAFFSCGCELGMIENMNAAKLQQALIEYEPYGFGMIPRVFEMMEDKIRQTIHNKGVIAEKAVMFLICLSSFLRRKFGLKTGRKMLGFVTKQVFGKNIITIGTGASVCRPSTSKFFIDLGLNWANFYASTETNVPAVSTGNFDRYPVAMAGNVKRNPEIEVKINAPDENGTGEIYIKSELMMKGYFRDDELTNQSYDGEFFKTGDYGYIDKDSNLFVTGRVKEAILLHNGKKISPSDVENYYKLITGEILVACCGYQKENENYDEVHMFIQTSGISEIEADIMAEKLYAASQKADNLYKIGAVHKIDRIPLTSVGKIKRFKLQQFLKNNAEIIESSQTELNRKSEANSIISIVKEHCKTNHVTYDSLIKEELAIDSLSFFELCVKIENVTGLRISDRAYEIKTVGDIVRLLDNKFDKRDKKYNINDFPVVKKDKDIKYIKRLKRFLCMLWRLEVSGLENIPDETRMIFCPNHESYFDALWVASALEKKNLSEKNICCLAAEHLMEKKMMKKAFNALGGIPVDRTGNTAPALERALHCLNKDNCFMFIHPEGTRSRSGKMGEFKQGAAQLAIKSGVKIVPVCIDGAYEVYPPHRRLPRIFDWKHFKRYTIKISFGKPLEVTGKNAAELTEQLQEKIVEMKNELK